MYNIGSIEKLYLTCSFDCIIYSHHPVFVFCVAVMEGGADIPSLLIAGGDGGSHVRVCEPGSSSRGAGGRDQAAVRCATVPTCPQTDHTQLWTCRTPTRL